MLEENKHKEAKEKRKNARTHLRLSIQYEKALPGGTFDIPIAVPLKDISQEGLSFYSQEKININSSLRIKMFISNDDYVVFMGEVVRITLSEEEKMNYLIGAKIKDIKEEDAKKIYSFLERIDINKVLEKVNITENVMDIHFIVDYPPVVKKVGKLVVEEGVPFDEYTLKCLLLSMLDEDRYKKFITTKEVNFIFTSQKGIRFRVNLHVQRGKTEGVFRIIPANIRSPLQLGLPNTVESLLDNDKGLILISGRTGSGKTTTLAAMVEYINNKRDAIIVCVEDPIEYIHVNNKAFIKQREIGRDTLSFYNAAKNALRQNPDVLVIGEILDMETMETAITAAETGALVLTSIHAGNVSQALDRVTSFFPADMQRHILKRLSLILRGVIAQELIPRIDNKGLVLASEILIVTPAVRRIIREGDWKQIPSMIQMGKGIGMQSMQESLEKLYRNRLIDEGYLKGEGL